MSVIAAAIKQLGYPGLHPKQELEMKNLLSGRDVFMSLPTGSGKLPCYCILPILQGPTASQSSVMVVSPLIALMKDQVRSVVEKGVQCDLKGPKYYLNSNLTRINCQTSWWTRNSQLSLEVLVMLILRMRSWIWYHSYLCHQISSDNC